ncbi:Zn-dependent protease with chaperone function [Prauserella marina]|uniref:Zn-dependent protease with chaperone function n=1 Tax=Prauserella marina TaxID=530584 RepID=A0A1G6NRY6_9PSEU|nr:M48 family metallopeptidase [Prauserella marina]PWV82477.1 Zn-dependent protease with chaperone function [Prauserella marina]SDC70124.1 Zn-dependent protease with chaperone function [Prauserella marina]
MRGSIRAFLAIALLVLFPFFVVGLGVTGIVFGFVTGHRTGIYIAILSFGMMLALSLALVQALRTKMKPPEGAVMTRHEQPGLWRLVDELAARAQTRPPDHIVLVPEINAAVSEDARALGLKPGTRYMMIGLPLLAGLNVSELRSVLAHELGHYGGGHTRLLAVSYRGAETLGRTVSRLDSGPARWILNVYSWLYAVLSRSANRAQELQADAYSVAAAGRMTAASALRKIATMDLVWEAFAERYLRLPSTARRTPDILLGFRLFLDHPNQQRALAEIEPKVLDSQPSSLLDSHPTIRRRIAAIEALPDVPVMPDTRPAWMVLTNAAQVVPAAETLLYINGELGPKASWEEIVRLAGAKDSEHGAQLLAKAANASGAAPSGTLGEILQAVHRGEAPRIMQPLLNGGGDPQQMRQAIGEGLTELLGDVIVCALISQGKARHELDWGGGWRVVGPSGVIDVRQLVTPAVANPAVIPQFVQHLTTMGVPLDFVRVPDAQPQQPQQQQGSAQNFPELLAVAPVITAFKKNWDVFVTEAGLLLVPLKTGKMAGQNLAGLVGQGGQALRKRITELLELGAPALFQQQGVQWLATTTILGGDKKKFFTGGGKVALQFAGGETATLRTQVDESYEALAEYLDSLRQGAPVNR